MSIEPLHSSRPGLTRRTVLQALGLAPLAGGLLGLISSTPVLAQTTPWISAEVRRIDAELGRLTLRHGEMPHLDMPPMTMVFSVLDRSWLQGLQAGHPVQVQIERREGSYVVTGLRTARPDGAARPEK